MCLLEYVVMFQYCVFRFVCVLDTACLCVCGLFNAGLQDILLYNGGQTTTHI